MMNTLLETVAKVASASLQYKPKLSSVGVQQRCAEKSSATGCARKRVARQYYYYDVTNSFYFNFGAF